MGTRSVLNGEDGIPALYDTPFGAIELEVLTNRLENNLTEEGGGNLDIDYSISLEGTDGGSQPAEHNTDVVKKVNKL